MSGGLVPQCTLTSEIDPERTVIEASSTQFSEIQWFLSILAIEPRIASFQMQTDRRKFLKGTLAASVIAGTAGSIAAQSPAPTDTADDVSKKAGNPWPIGIFEKPFEGLSFDQLADAMQQIGADGIEATIRKGGHIEPNKAAEQVPELVEALGKKQKRIVIAATSIAVADAAAEDQLRILSENGITHYRMAHYRYEFGKPMMDQLREFAAQAKDLAAMSKSLGIQGLYQTHSGSTKKGGYLGSLGMDLATALEGVDPDGLGVAFDTRHVRKDTGSSWRTALAALKSHIRSIYVKDGVWRGNRSTSYADVPLDTGFVTEEFFDEVRRDLPAMPLSIHMEWLGYRVFPKDEIPDAIYACRLDTRVLRKWIG
jgi:sugar phosphate isomerase/epimerase